MKRCLLTLVCLTALAAKIPTMAETAADDVFTDDFNSKSYSQKQWIMLSLLLNWSAISL